MGKIIHSQKDRKEEIRNTEKEKTAYAANSNISSQAGDREMQTPDRKTKYASSTKGHERQTQARGKLRNASQPHKWGTL